MVKENTIQQRSFKFALDIIQLYLQMTAQKEYVLSKQLLRSATSIGANVEEAIAAQSKADFLHKMNIALKEGRETHYWIRLLKSSALVNVDFTGVYNESLELNNIMGAIVRTTRKSTLAAKQNSSGKNQTFA